MNPVSARRTLVLYSLLTTVVFSAGIILSPLVIPVDAPGAYRLVQIIFPVFAGYLGSAAVFVFNPVDPEPAVADAGLLKHLIHGPFYIFWFLGAVVFFYFYISNLPTMRLEGMKISELANYLTMLVAFMNGTVGALTMRLFAPGKPSPAPKR